MRVERNTTPNGPDPRKAWEGALAAMGREHPNLVWSLQPVDPDAVLNGQPATAPDIHAGDESAQSAA